MGGCCGKSQKEDILYKRYSFCCCCPVKEHTLYDELIIDDDEYVDCILPTTNNIYFPPRLVDT